MSFHYETTSRVFDIQTSAINNQRVISVGTTPIQIYPATNLIFLVTTGTNPILIGNSSMTAANGFPLAPNFYFRWTVVDGFSFWAVCSATQNLYMLEIKPSL